MEPQCKVFNLLQTGCIAWENMTFLFLNVQSVPPCFTTHLQPHLSLTACICAPCPFKLKNLEKHHHHWPSWHDPHKHTQWAHHREKIPQRSVCAQKEREGLSWGSICRRKETIRGFLFTSQRTQTRVDPTAEEQSVEEIKKEVRQHRVNMYPHRLIIPPAPGLTMHCGKCPNSLMPCQCPRCTDLWRDSIKQARQCIQDSILWHERYFKRNSLYCSLHFDLYKTQVRKNFWIAKTRQESLQKGSCFIPELDFNTSRTVQENCTALHRYKTAGPKEATEMQLRSELHCLISVGANPRSLPSNSHLATPHLSTVVLSRVKLNKR